jgi:predicted permease
MIAGRAFSAGEERRKERVVVLSESLWRRRFGADPSVPGRSIRLSQVSFTVVGVVSQHQAVPAWAEVWMPLSHLEPMVQQERRFHPLEVVARLRPDASVGSAQAEMTALARRLAATYPATNRELGAVVVPLLDQITAPVRPALMTAWAAAALVLLVVCANVAHLLLTRTLARRRELSVRLGLGASGGDLFRLLASESIVLAVLGGVFGAATTGVLLPVLRSWAASRVPRLEEISIDGGVLLYALGVTALTVLVVIIPSWLQLRRMDLNQALKDGDDRISIGGSRWSSALMASEVALAFAVFAGALLLVRNFTGLLATNPGFDGSRVLALDITVPARPDGWKAASRVFEDRLAPAIRALPSVEAVATANMAPMSLEATDRSRYTTSFAPLDSVGSPEPAPIAQLRWISEDYFRVLAIPLLQGRWLTAEDRYKPRRVVNAALARRYFPHGSAVGRQILLGVDTPAPTTVEIVGVAGDVRDLALDLDPQPAVYMLETSPRMTLLARTKADPAALAPAITRIVHEVEPEAPITRAGTINQIVAASLARQRFALVLMSVFAAVAGVLSLIGTYGVVACITGRRSREFGIRTAVGARPRDVAGLVIRQTLRSLTAGLLGGAALYLGMSRLFNAVAPAMSAADPLTLAGAALLVLLAALAAAALPAVRASQVDPNRVLRQT